MKVLREALIAADAIVMPLRVSAFDLAGAYDALDLVKQLGQQERLVLVLNNVDSRSPAVSDALAAIKPFSPNKPMRIAHRNDYATASFSARGGIEINRDAATEVAALWTSIQNVLRRTEKNDRQNLQRQPRGSASTTRRRKG